MFTICFSINPARDFSEGWQEWMTLKTGDAASTRESRRLMPISRIDLKRLSWMYQKCQSQTKWRMNIKILTTPLTFSLKIQRYRKNFNLQLSQPQLLSLVANHRYYPNKGYYDKYSLHFSCYILPIVLKQHFIFCLLWLYTHYIIDRQISYSILHLHLLRIG